MADETYVVERSIVINAPARSIYELVADFREWRDWSPWEGLDPDLQRTYSGSESGVGAAYEWSGNRKAGKGSMTITEGIEPSHVRLDLVFEKPFKARNDMVLAVQPEGSGSRVIWTMTGERTFMVKVMGLVKSMDKFIGPDFEKGLLRLKTVAESKR